MPRDGEIDEDASLLARMPLTPRSLIEREPQYWPALYQQVERRLNMLRSIRWTWWGSWMQLGEFFLPRRARAWVVANNWARGRYLNDSIVDGIGSKAAEDCAAGLWSGLTNPARPWFSIETALEGVELDQEAKDWIAELRAGVFTILAQSNFYNAMAQFFQDITVFGTSVLQVLEDREDVIRCHIPCAGEFFLGVGARGDVNTFYHEFTWTVLQIVQKWGIDQMPDSVRNDFAQGTMDKEYIVCCAIEPNFAIAGNPRRPRERVNIISTKFAYRQVYWLRGQKTQRPLEVKGYYDQPFMAGRWSIVSNDAYGRGPGFAALGDQKQVQQETNRKAEFLEKGVRPPMGADSDMKNEPASVMPGMVTFMNTANGKKGFWPLFEVNAIWLQHMVVDIKSIQDRLKEYFYIPQFMAISNMQGVQPRNELELSKRDLERLQILGPMINLFEDEVASPAIRRVVGIMLRRGMVKPMPQSLAQTPLKITYTSLARQAQKAAESVAMKDGFATLGGLSAAAKAAGLPDPMRTINLDQSAKHYLSLTGFPLQFVYSKTEVEQQDQARAQAIAQEKQQQMMVELAPAAVQAAKVAADAHVPGGSSLNSMLTGSTA